MSISTGSLSVFMCPLIDINELTGIDCSVLHPDICVKCDLKGGYLSGESIYDLSSVSHLIYLTIWASTIVIGTLGLFGNFLIIKILKRRNSKRAFDFLLTVLAAADTFSCIIAMIACTVPIFYFQNWIRGGHVFMYSFIISFNTMLFGRSLSIFTAVLITIQSFFMIAFPVPSCQWFTPRKTKLLSLSVLLFSVSLSIPRYSSVYIGVNPYSHEDFQKSHLHEFPYLLKPTALHEFWYTTLNGMHNQIDYWAPLPLLVFFKFLSYWNVRKLNKTRRGLNCNQQIQAVRMFLPVVIVLIICNFSPILYYILMHFKKVVYRELYALVCLSTALNSSVNFPIYYFRASNFRSEAKVLLNQIFILFSNVARNERCELSRL
ncbi:unnamed protein product [Orchesella dallaii]|uniref:G-protein coupled receptors family 1 profile domain-containing protein n=1 Tax=Orchesella dallaii TaxID=48710 RepID=A0ABP1Q034_9HEXA